ncbi:MAG TPA: AmmeMemoRadiSam system protein B [Bacteroidales bacterium]|nr:AmmeMemoRadiSam system protein B [Bacteroidales bacterium]
MVIRKPAVAGQFYPGSEKKLKELLERMDRGEPAGKKISLSGRQILGAVVPHAGYMYSGRHALHFFRLLAASGQPFDTAVIINPNHHGYGPEIALDVNDAWETPLGVVAVDTELAELLSFSWASPAHDSEHSGEVMVPFLQHFFRREFRILPVTLSRQTHENARKIAEGLRSAAGKLNRKIVVIASSDFSHFLSPEEGRAMDELVLREILALKPQGVEEQVHRHEISVCGYGPIMTLMEYALISGHHPKAEVLSRGHSGEVVPSREVVDYLTILFTCASD